MMTGNIIDYLEWYGDFDFSILPFNEVDNLILAELSYARLEGIVPGVESGRGSTITVAEAAALLREGGSVENSCKLEKNAGMLLYTMARGRRFAGAGLCNYVNKHDFENQEQFAALHILLSDGTIFVSYAGTDDTILGWKEDLNMAYRMPVPAQEEAVAYLESTLDKEGCPVRIGGHSKGGNLAIYASVMCNEGLKRRIMAIYNNDGPGFLNSMLDRADYKRIEERITTIVPETSIIGMLLEHGDRYVVVKSAGKGIWQHDGMSWQVYKDGFVKLDELSKNSLIIDRTLSTWIMALNDEQRGKFVDTVYSLLTGAGIKNMSDLEHYNFATLNAMIKEMAGMDSKTSKMMRQLFRALIAEYSRSVVIEKRIAGRRNCKKESTVV